MGSITELFPGEGHFFLKMLGFTIRVVKSLVMNGSLFLVMLILHIQSLGSQFIAE